MHTTIPLDHQALRSISQSGDRPDTHGTYSLSNSYSQNARHHAINGIQSDKKNKLGDLNNSSRSPHVVHNKRPDEVENKVVKLKKKTMQYPRGTT